MDPTAEVFDEGAVLGRVEVREEMAGERGRPIPAPEQDKEQWWVISRGNTQHLLSISLHLCTCTVQVSGKVNVRVFNTRLRSV